MVWFANHVAFKTFPWKSMARVWQHPWKGQSAVWLPCFLYGNCSAGPGTWLVHVSICLFALFPYGLRGSWMVMHIIPLGQNHLVTPSLSQSLLMVWSTCQFMYSLVISGCSNVISVISWGLLNWWYSRSSISCSWARDLVSGEVSSEFSPFC